MPGFGEVAPFFTAPTDVNPRFHLASLGGRWMLLMFHGSLGVPSSKLAHDAILARRALFDDNDAILFGVSVDPHDRSTRGLCNSLPGLRYFWDFDSSLSRLYGVAAAAVYKPTAFLIDPQLRIAAVAPVSHVEALLDRLEKELAAEAPSQTLGLAPVLMLPRVFEPELCRELVAYYERIGGERSGFMSEEGGKTVGRLDDGRKRRRDASIADADLQAATRNAIANRIVPMVERVFGWRATRVERYIVACYSSEEQGFFFPHRDNLAPGTAHRKFAVTLNLNDDFDGGELRFPEFGTRTYRPPLGGATVFGCRMLHEATPVTRGVRYAFLPFLYDDEGAQVREANKHTIVPPPAVHEPCAR